MSFPVPWMLYSTVGSTASSSSPPPPRPTWTLSFPRWSSLWPSSPHEPPPDPPRPSPHEVPPPSSCGERASPADEAPSTVTPSAGTKEETSEVTPSASMDSTASEASGVVPVRVTEPPSEETDVTRRSRPASPAEPSPVSATVVPAATPSGTAEAGSVTDEPSAEAAQPASGTTTTPSLYVIDPW